MCSTLFSRRAVTAVLCILFSAPYPVRHLHKVLLTPDALTSLTTVWNYFQSTVILSVAHSLSHRTLPLPPSLVATSSLAVPIPLLKMPKAFFFTVLVALLTGTCPLWLHCIASATSVAKCFISLLLPLLKHYLCTSFILKANFSLSFLLWLSASVSPYPLPCSLTVCAPSGRPHALPFLCILISHILKS